MIVAALNDLDWRPRTVCVRINDVETQWCHDDIIEVVTGAGAKIDTIMLTKAKSVHDVMFVHLLLDQLESKLKLPRRIGIECLIEEVEGMMNVDAIAACSDRLECLIFGMGDYSASQQMQAFSVGESGPYPGDVWHYPRYRMTIACRANGIDPVDGPYANFRNPDSFRREAERAYALGMIGKWAIHPSQVEIAQQVFSPAADADRERSQTEAGLRRGARARARRDQRRRRDGRRRVDPHRAESARSRRPVRPVGRCQALQNVQNVGGARRCRTCRKCQADRVLPHHLQGTTATLRTIRVGTTRIDQIPWRQDDVPLSDR